MKSKNRKLVKFIRYFIDEYQWRHRNTIFIILSIILSYVLLTSQYIHDLVVGLGSLGYLGSFIVGMFFTYALTTIPATIGLFLLGESLDPLLIALVGAAGAVVSDFLIYRFVKDSFIKGMEDFSPTIKKDIRQMTKNIKKSRILKNFIPIIAGLIIASPLPDELATGLLGMMKFQPKKFLLYAYFFNFLGILAITSAAKIL